MKAVHFGAGNIGRGFIGEVLADNGFQVTFVDVNEEVIDELNRRHAYKIGFADGSGKEKEIQNVSGINSREDMDAVVHAVAEADIVTTALGPNVLPFIAESIAKGLQERKQKGVQAPLDVIACENMIGGSSFLKEKVLKYLSEEDKDYVAQYIGFPNAAVDRIVPQQQHEDPLYVMVEPFKEWVVERKGLKATNIDLEGVKYVEDLTPFIERKLFTVNTGHATTAYTGSHYGHKTVDEALEDERVLDQVKRVLAETGSLLKAKWDFDTQELEDYANKTVERFQNPHISDDLARVARTPIRKLGYEERFIRPIRELKEAGLSYGALLDTVGLIFNYEDPADEQSVQLQEMRKSSDLHDVVTEVTGLNDEELISEIISKVD
ncbi:mannitol-1-phosphate 5-dehydrogenase [Dolosicoccus paucivorans]|uniref:Mannitol-1-phosphate 5-dehydrogenase n=1 Tax=Dolosicoccus paucivorans TaxID=84521 RepID=A0A2N6SNB2_9LACT|nr:mannitol-1-phosphate 5-dehydrogenase [Dolosicoccus paucivorans]PMB84807.1 mannitol-1-phosphate 5-dehydrogenase [Dolosicoccus paucivorans]PMC58551.1 mannitol-1-phosphate 5-dehydrogenase [Dolosicoccus paucivorans]